MSLRVNRTPALFEKQQRTANEVAYGHDASKSTGPLESLLTELQSGAILTHIT